MEYEEYKVKSIINNAFSYILSFVFLKITIRKIT